MRHEIGIDFGIRIKRRGVVLDVFEHKAHRAGKVGRSHTRTRQFRPAVRYGGSYFAAVRGYFGFEFKVGRRPPTREVGHKRTGFLLFAYSESTRFSRNGVVGRRNERVCRVHRYRTGRHGVVQIAETHSYNARNVIVNYARCRAFLFSRSDLFFKGNVSAAAYHRDFAPYVNADVVSRLTEPGYYDVVEIGVLIAVVIGFNGNRRVVHYFFDKVFLVAVAVGRFGKVQILFRAVYGYLYIFGFLTVDTRNAHRRVEGGRRTNGCGVGAGGKVSTVHAVIRRTVIVARRDHKAYARLSYLIVNALHKGVVCGGEACGRTETHIDNVYFEFDAVFERAENVDGLRAAEPFFFFVIGKDLEYGELRVGRDAGKGHGVTVFIEYFVAVLILNRLIVAILVENGRTGDNARDVRAVVRIGRIYVGVVVRVVVRERDFGVIINVVYGNGLVFGDKTFARFAVENFAFYGRFVKRRHARFGYGHSAERRVRIVETGIEHRHDHTASVVTFITEFFGYFINTRTPDVGFVLNVYILRRVIVFGHGNVVYAAYFLYVGDIFDVDFKRDGVGDRIIRVFVLVRHVRRVEFS